MKKKIFFALILSLFSHEAFCMKKKFSVGGILEKMEKEKRDYDAMNHGCNNKRVLKQKNKTRTNFSCQDHQSMKSLFGTPKNSPIDVRPFFDDLRNDSPKKESCTQKSSDEIYKDNLNKCLVGHIFMYIRAVRNFGNLSKEYFFMMADTRCKSSDPNIIYADAKNMANDYNDHIKYHKQKIVFCLKHEKVDVNKKSKLPKSLASVYSLDGYNAPRFPLEWLRFFIPEEEEEKRLIRLREWLIELLKRHGAKEYPRSW